MDNSKHGYIPMQERLDLNKTQGAITPGEVERMQNVPYTSAVGSILYAVRCTRPDVAFAQNITSRFQQNPGKSHWIAVKTILKYLRNTKEMFLGYGKNPKAKLTVDCYCNVGFETDRDEIKSLTGYLNIIAALETEMEAVWIRKFISRLGSGYQQKDRKPSQNDKTEHGMEKTVQNQGQSPKIPKSESIQKNQQSNSSLTKRTIPYMISN
ncbi:hypothetical protein Tco_0063376 [Tanacetum coccineum]